MLLASYNMSSARKLVAQMEKEKSRALTKYWQVDCKTFHPEFGFIISSDFTKRFMGQAEPLLVRDAWSRILVPAIQDYSDEIDPTLIENVLWLAGYKKMQEEFFNKIESNVGFKKPLFYRGLKTTLKTQERTVQCEKYFFIRIKELFDEVYKGKRTAPEESVAILPADEGLLPKTQVTTKAEVEKQAALEDTSPKEGKDSSPIPWILGGGALVLLAAMS